MQGLRIEPLGGLHDRSSFRCGVPELDDYLVRLASQDIRRRVAAVFVMVAEERPKRIPGSSIPMSVRPGWWAKSARQLVENWLDSSRQIHRSDKEMKVAIVTIVTAAFLLPITRAAETLPLDVQRVMDQRAAASDKIDRIYLQDLEKLKVNYTKNGDLNTANKIASLKYEIVSKNEDALPPDVHRVVDQRAAANDKIDKIYLQELEKLKINYTKNGDLSTANKIVSLKSEIVLKNEVKLPEATQEAIIGKWDRNPSGGYWEFYADGTGIHRARTGESYKIRWRKRESKKGSKLYDISFLGGRRDLNRVIKINNPNLDGIETYNNFTEKISFRQQQSSPNIP
jgi:hypothetical protein